MAPRGSNGWLAINDSSVSKHVIATVHWQTRHSFLWARVEIQSLGPAQLPAPMTSSPDPDGLCLVGNPADQPDSMVAHVCGLLHWNGATLIAKAGRAGEENAVGISEQIRMHPAAPSGMCRCGTGHSWAVSVDVSCWSHNFHDPTITNSGHDFYKYQGRPAGFRIQMTFGPRSRNITINWHAFSERYRQGEMAIQEPQRNSNVPDTRCSLALPTAGPMINVSTPQLTRRRRGSAKAAPIGERAEYRVKHQPPCYRILWDGFCGRRMLLLLRCW